ncbi:MAG: Ig-like domain-containing protein, partial [Ferruginibacter sp.]
QFIGGCAQIGVPVGGPKDTIAPMLTKANPTFGSTKVTNNTITLSFDEYIDLQDLQQNLIISPLQNKNPTITANPKSITIKFKDTLLPNTTYTINFGNAIRDFNENNITKDFTYLFSTGKTLDSATISGKVLIAESGGIDSTIIVLLYRNAVDSTVKNKKPNYIAKLKGDGSFQFKNLPTANFKIYALKDADGGKTYNTKFETFAFLQTEVSSTTNENVLLYAYAEEKAAENNNTTSITKKNIDKKLKLQTNIQSTKDLLEPLEISYNNPLKDYDFSKIYLTDTFYKKITTAKYSLDSTSKKITLSHIWQPETTLILIIEKDAAADSVGNKINKTDTIRFTTKRKEDYGRITLRFNDLDLFKTPVLQFLNGETVKYTYPLTSKEWSNSMFPPGEYDIRILYDTDKNGKWTPGNYTKKIQPELGVTIPQKLSIRADWDNEQEINL